MVKPLALILVLTLLGAANAGCNRYEPPRRASPEVREACLQEGFDPDTTEFVDCVKELSSSDAE